MPVKKIFIFVFFLFCFWIGIFYQKDIKNFFYKLSWPIEKILIKTGNRFYNFFSSIISAKKIQEENKVLKQENQQLIYSLALLETCKKENEFLKNSLNLKNESNWEILPADIVGKDFFSDFILINKGKKDGVQNGLAVITPQKVLIGKIQEVFENFSRVILVSHHKFNLPAKILNKEGKILITGKGETRIFADLIDLNMEINDSDIVVVGPNIDLIPPNLLIGRIKEIKHSDLLSYQQAEIEPFFNLAQTDKVFIIINY